MGGTVGCPMHRVREKALYVNIGYTAEYETHIRVTSGYNTLQFLK